MLRANLYGVSQDKSTNIHLKYIEYYDDGKFKIKKTQESAFTALSFISKNPYIYDNDFFKSIEFKANILYYKIIPNEKDFIKKECSTEDGLRMSFCEGFTFSGILITKKNKNDKGTSVKMNFTIEQGI